MIHHPSTDCIPDDDFEDIIDRMVDEMEGNMPSEGENKMGPQGIKPGDRVDP